MATDKNINDSALIKLEDADFADALNRFYGSRVGGTEDGYGVITELVSYIQTNTDLSSKEEVIERPSTQPAVVTGTPNTLTIDLNSRKQGLFEPRLSVGTLSINLDFDLVINNKANADLASIVLSLTGTRIITFESDVLVSNASTLGTWASPDLTITAGTDDLIEFQFLRYKTSSKWLLKVGEVSI